MVNSVFPEDLYCESALSFLVCNWSNWLGDELLNINEDIFKHFGLSPFEANASCNGQTSNGKYGRIKHRVKDFLNSNASFVDLKMVSESIGLDDFFPSKIVTAFCLDFETLNEGIVSYRGNDARCDNLTILDIYERHLKRLGLFYGGAFLFPAKYGPDYYLSSINVLPKGAKFGSNVGYAARLNNWRENSKVRKLNPLDGYFREIYLYNFVTESHLKRQFDGGSMMQFMKGCGSLIQLSNDTPQFLWSVEPSKLADVGNVLETSGLVLSSRTRPL